MKAFFKGFFGFFSGDPEGLGMMAASILIFLVAVIVCFGGTIFITLLCIKGFL